MKLVSNQNASLKNIYLQPGKLGNINFKFNFLIEEVMDKTDFEFVVTLAYHETGQVIGGEVYTIKCKENFFMPKSKVLIMMIIQ